LHVVGDDNLIEDNLFAMRVATGAGPDDAISISGDRNTIEGNKVVQVSGTVLDGIDVKSGATGNIIGHNDLVDTTTPIRDDGTDTVLPPGVWRDWTPSYTNLTVGGGATVTSRYTQVEGQVTVHYSVTLGTSPTVGDVRVDLPVTASSSYHLTDDIIGVARFIDATGANYSGQARIQSTTTVRLMPEDATGSFLFAAILSSTVPFTWTDGDKINFILTYEAA
jgi:hypothetical protein